MHMYFILEVIITGNIARSANLPVFSLLRGRFLRFFAPHGRHVAPMGVKFGMEEGTEGQFRPHRYKDKGV